MSMNKTEKGTIGDFNRKRRVKADKKIEKAC